MKNTTRNIGKKNSAAIETAKFLLRDVLIDNCVGGVNPNAIEKITEQLYAQITSSNCSWAFKEVLNENK